MPVPPSMPGPSAKAQYLLVIVVDGLRPDALQRAQTPHIDRLWQSGLYSWKAQTVRPSLTLPAIASLLTGLPPERHGVLQNVAELVALQAPTIFDIAYAAQISAAAFVGKRKLQALLRAPGLFSAVGKDSREIVQAAVDYIAEHRPRLVFLHLAEVDTVGHQQGWMTVQQMQAVAEIDEALGRLLHALEALDLLKDSVIILTADHGGHGRIHGTDDPRDLTIPWILWTPEIGMGRELERTVYIYETAPTVLAALGLTIPQDWPGGPVLEAFPAVTKP